MTTRPACAALAYYTVFSVAPLLLIVISVAGIVFGDEAARGAVVGQIGGLVGDEGAKAIEAMLVSLRNPEKSTATALLSTLTLLVGATTVFAELQGDLDRIWRVPERKKPSGIWELLRARILSFGMILGIGFLLIVSLVASAAVAAIGRYWSPMLGEDEVFAHLIDMVLSFGMVTVVFAMIYKIMPHAAVRWPDVWLGAFVTSMLFTIGKLLIGLYIGKAGVATGYGAAGSLVVVLVWVYYSAQIFLLAPSSHGCTRTGSGRCVRSTRRRPGASASRMIIVRGRIPALWLPDGPPAAGQPVKGPPPRGIRSRTGALPMHR